MIPISKYVDMSVKERGGLIRHLKILIERELAKKTPNKKWINKAKSRVDELTRLNNLQRIYRYYITRNKQKYWDSFVA